MTFKGIETYNSNFLAHCLFIKIPIEDTNKTTETKGGIKIINKIKKISWLERELNPKAPEAKTNNKSIKKNHVKSIKIIKTILIEAKIFQKIDNFFLVFLFNLFI